MKRFIFFTIVIGALLTLIVGGAVAIWPKSMTPEQTQSFFCDTGSETAGADIIDLVAKQQVLDVMRSELMQSQSMANVPTLSRILPGIDVAVLLNPIKTDYCTQATSIVSEVLQLKSIYPDPDLKEQKSRAKSLLTSWRDVLSFVSDQITQATKTMKSWQTANSLPMYNPEQGNALRTCVDFIYAGSWEEADKSCEQSISLAIPPSPTPTVTYTPTITYSSTISAIPSETPISPLTMIIVSETATNTPCGCTP